MLQHGLADDEQLRKLRCFMVLPEIRVNVGQLVTVGRAPTDIYYLVMPIVVFVQQLRHCVN